MSRPLFSGFERTLTPPGGEDEPVWQQPRGLTINRSQHSQRVDARTQTRAAQATVNPEPNKHVGNSVATLKPPSKHNDPVPPTVAFGKPDDEWEAYLELVLARDVKMYKIDPRTWVAELYDLETGVNLVSVDCCMSFGFLMHALQDTFPENPWHAFRKWTHVRGDCAGGKPFKWVCSNCEQYKRDGTCVHTCVLQHEAMNYGRYSIVGAYQDSNSTIYY